MKIEKFKRTFTVGWKSFQKKEEDKKHQIKYIKEVKENHKKYQDLHIFLNIFFPPSSVCDLKQMKENYQWIFLSRFVFITIFFFFLILSRRILML